MKTKKIILLLLGCTFFGVGLVTVMFLLSEEKMQRNNAFQRRYLPHPIKELNTIDLGINSYYIAGINDSLLYLGNINAPLKIKTVNYYTSKIIDNSISITNMDLPYRNVKIKVRPPHFFVGDGTVPIIFKGNIRDWKSDVFSTEAYFTQFTVLDSSTISIITTSSETFTKVIGVLEREADSTNLNLNNNILTKQVDGIFDTDGMMLWNENLKKIIYPYYYRNQFEVVDNGLNHEYTGKTIDTISQAQIDIAYFTSKDQYKRGGNSVVVNRNSATYGNYLFIQSDRLGKYEEEDVLYSASIIDVYGLKDYSYLFSFYVYHQPKKKVTEFIVNKNIFIALVEDKVWIYQLKPDYFDTGI